MRGCTPNVRTATPIPRKPRPLLLSSKKRRTLSPVPKGQEAVACGLVSPPKAVVFRRMHPPVMEGVTLPEAELSALRNTRTLFLCCRNLLSFSHIRYLEHMVHLSSLNVHMNAISRIEYLGHLHHLTDLDISANELRAVDDDAFKGLRQLKRLNMSSNFLKNVNGFQHLPALEWLSLSFNELEDIRGLRLLPCPHHLRHLDICGNKLATFVALEESLENCRGLEDIRVETPKGALVLPSTPPQLQLRENPFCATEPKYAEKLLERFQHLVRLNGVSCGYDPTTDARPTDHLAAAGFDDQLRWQPLDVASSVIVDLNERFLLHHDGEGAPCDGAAAVTAVGPSGLTTGDKSNSSSSDGSSSGNNNNNNNNRGRGGSGEIPKFLALPHRPSCVSRGVLTNVSIPTHKELHLSTVEQVAFQEELHAKIEHLELNLKRAQEQLSLRVALEEDLRRCLKEVRMAHLTLVDSAAREKKLLSRQVAALKDELSRRSEEAAILQRKNRVELEEQTSAIRANLLRHKKESASAIRRLEEELLRTQRDASDRVLELNAKLDDAARHNKWLEQQNGMVQSQMEKWREELHSSRSTLLEYDKQRNSLERVCQLQLEESTMRHQLELVSWCDIVSSAAAHLRVLQGECESLLTSQHNLQRAWEDYTASLQQHYQEALLQSQAARTIRPVSMEDVGCDPVVVHSWNEKEEGLKQLQSALSLSRQSEKLLARENERLLSCMAEKDRDLAEAAQQLQKSENAARSEKEGLERERENLVRTLHNLRETIEKKDVALDELEAEAKLKIDEKRVTIARLEARLEDADDAIANYRHEVEKLRRAKEELEHAKSELQTLKQERSGAALPQQRQQQMAELMDALEDTKQKLAMSMVREHQLSMKLTHAAEALKLVRQQLARVDEENNGLRNELGEREVLLRAAEAEHRRLQEHWKEAQETTRVRQRATLQALSQIMVESGVVGVP